jgi:Xaa-Pro aminopeptidase
MKSDLQGLLKERNLDLAIVLGEDGTLSANPTFTYLTGTADHLTGVVIVRSKGKMQLIHGTMERDTAEKTGLELINRNRWSMRDILEKYPDLLDANVELYRQIFSDLGIQGRVAFYGTGAIGTNYRLLQRLAGELSGVAIVGEFERDIFQVARETKDKKEIERMSRVGRLTCEIVEATVKFLQSHKVKSEKLVRDDGNPLTIADVKSFVRLETLKRGLEEPGGHIFAIGRDAGVPHNVGNPDSAIELGKTIIFDIFPREPAGYYHDMTRTFCLGYASPEVEQAYREVLECFERAVSSFRAGQPTQRYQLETCDIFEARGHETIRKNPQAQSGYIHSLGHGLGLDVHEQPLFATFGNFEKITLQPGMVFTVEPGLYYPEKGFGIRIEDTYYCDNSGKFHSLTPYPKDLVVPMK